MMQTGMVKGNTAYSSYLDGMPVSDFLLPHPVHIPHTHTTYPSQLLLREFVRINEHENLILDRVRLERNNL